MAKMAFSKVDPNMFPLTYHCQICNRAFQWQQSVDYFLYEDLFRRAYVYLSIHITGRMDNFGKKKGNDWAGEFLVNYHQKVNYILNF